MKKEYLYPGRIIVSVEPAQITTILGSCVAVALHDPTTKVAGLIHYLLDTPSGGDQPTPRYGSVAILAVLDLMAQKGAKRKLAKAKVYGGASVLKKVVGSADIGGDNVEIALKMLGELNIPILEQNTGGVRGRRLVLTTDTFHVQHEFMRGPTEIPRAAPDDVPVLARPPSRAVAGRKIGIVDVSSAVGGYFAKVLNKNGFGVAGAAMDAAETYQLIYWQKPSLLLCGIHESRPDSLALLRELQRYGNLPPLIVYSFGGDGRMVRQALGLGVIDFVHAPTQFEPRALISIGNLLIEKIGMFLQDAA